MKDEFRLKLCNFYGFITDNWKKWRLYNVSTAILQFPRMRYNHNDSIQIAFIIIFICSSVLDLLCETCNHEQLSGAVGLYKKLKTRLSLCCGNSSIVLIIAYFLVIRLFLNEIYKG